MCRARIFVAAAAVTATLAASNAVAVVTTYNWNPVLTGPQDWQVNGNWDIANFPTTNLDVANLSVGLGSNLTLNVGATDVTVAGLNLGSTTSAVTTNVTSTGPGRLVFQNSDPDTPGFNNKNALVTSGGVAGSTNTISAPILINAETLEFGNTSTNNITVTGPIAFSNVGGNSAIRSFMPAGMKVTVSSPITLVEATDGVTAANLAINNNNAATIGTIELSGQISGAGRLDIGPTNGGGGVGTVILSGNNTYTGRTTANRGNIVLASDSAFGVDTMLGDPALGGANYLQGNPSNVLVFNLISDNDARKISVDMQVAQWQTVSGQNSLELAGATIQSNSRGWVNLLPAGKTLTLSGAQYIHREGEDAQRLYTFDGTGKTILSGGIHNQFGASPTMLGILVKRGTGTLVVNGSIQGTPMNSDYTGATIIEAGNLHFAKDGDFSATAHIASYGGAVGVDDPTSPTFSNATFLGKFDAVDNGGLMLTSGESGAGLNFTSGDLATFVPNMSVAAPETGTSASPFDYTGTITPSNDAVTTRPTYRLGGGSGSLRLQGAQLTGATSDLVVTNGGEVILSGANTYAGKTSILAKYNTSNTTNAINQVAVGGAASVIYQGTTLSVTNLASGASSSIGGASDAASNLVIQGSTLKYIGGAASTNRLFTVGTGGGTIDASGSGPLTINNTSALDMDIAEDRTASYEDFGLNSYPPVGAGLDGQGGNFNPHNRLQIDRTDDLVVGMPIVSTMTLLNQQDMVTTQPLPQPTAIASVNNPISNPTFTYGSSVNLTVGTTTTTTPYKGTGTVSFAGVARTFALTGSNTGDNTFRPLIADAAATTAGSVNTVNLAKNGTGKWILTNNNTYAGTTAVNAGTLLINGTHSGVGAVTVAAGATLGGTGSLAGAVTNNGTISPGASVGSLTLGAGLTMGANSSWTAELLGASADLLAITGNLDLSALGNALNVVDLGKTGTSWLLATVSGTINGTFESITSGYTVDYGVATPGQLRLNFTGVVGVPGDYSGNGVVDTADYVIWREALNTGATSLPNEGGISLGSVDQLDYNFWKSRFGATSGSGSAIGGGAVPEPASAMLVLLAAFSAFGLFGRGRRVAGTR